MLVRILNDRGYKWWNVGDYGWVTEGCICKDGSCDIKHCEHYVRALFEASDYEIVETKNPA